MLFKPNFCCNCGEKIQRAEWRLTTSRRFCNACEAEFKGHEWMPRAVVVIGIIFGLYGFGSYIAGPSELKVASLKEPAQQVSIQKNSVGLNSDNGIKFKGDVTAAEQKAVSPENELSTGQARSALVKEAPGAKPGLQEEAVHFCGAMTKKGKPCSRRVKSKGRCWQHVGQPSALVSQSQPDVY